MPDTPATSLYHYRANVISVYDGDTLQAMFDLGMEVHIKQTIRLVGINAPEMRGGSKKKATQARDYLRAQALNKDVIIQTIKDKTEKYGRYLGRIFVLQPDGSYLDVNKELIRLGLAVPFMDKDNPA